MDSGNGKPEVKGILRQLQRTLKCLLQESDVWNKSQDVGIKHLDGIVNVAEQLQCCARVKITDTPLGEFPDLKGKLMYKLNQTIEEDMQYIHKSYNLLQKTQEKLNTQCKITMGLYNSSKKKLSVEELTVGTPMRPCLATMLEWLNDLDELCFELLITQEHLLDNLDYTNPECMDYFQHNWPKCKALQEKINEVKTYTIFFMDEKI